MCTFVLTDVSQLLRCTLHLLTFIQSVTNCVYCLRLYLATCHFPSMIALCWTCFPPVTADEVTRVVSDLYVAMAHI